MTQFLSTKNIQYNVGDHQLIEVEIEVVANLLFIQNYLKVEGFLKNIFENQNQME